jgi:hypothetical protein
MQPVITPSYGYNSFINFNDDFSRYDYIYHIHEQFEMLDKFNIFKAEL